MRALATATEAVPRAAAAQDKVPLLSNCLFDAAADLVVEATDNELFVRRVLPATVSHPGRCLLPASRLSECLRSCRDEEVEVGCDGARAYVRGPRTDFDLPAGPIDQWPELARDEVEAYHLVDGEALERGLSLTAFAARKSGDTVASSRVSMTGVLVDVADDGLTLVATDGGSMAAATVPATAQGGASYESGKLILSPRFVGLAQGVLRGAGPVRVSFDDSRSTIAGDGFRVSGLMLQANFVRYRTVMDKKFANAAAGIDTAEFLACVRQAASVLAGDSVSVSLTFGPAGIRLEAAGFGKAKVDFAATYEGLPLGIRVDHRMLLKMLAVLKGRPSRLAVQGDGKAMLFDVAEPGDGVSSYRYFVARCGEGPGG